MANDNRGMYIYQGVAHVLVAKGIASNGDTLRLLRHDDGCKILRESNAGTSRIATSKYTDRAHAKFLSRVDRVIFDSLA